TTPPSPASSSPSGAAIPWRLRRSATRSRSSSASTSGRARRWSSRVSSSTRPRGSCPGSSGGSEKARRPASVATAAFRVQLGGVGAQAGRGRLRLAALGVVFGDIGTSPLYAIREAFFGVHPLPPDRENVLGILSLIFWSLIVVVSLKYLVFVLRADNRGEGGIFALLSLLGARRAGAVTLLALVGASLLYGDGIITPAISVLSAVEGLEVATSTFRPVV